MITAEIDFCTPADAARLHYIETECFDDPWARHIFEYDLENQGPIVHMKASLKCGAVGFVVVSRDEGLARILDIAVLPEYRRLSIASQLMMAAEVLSEEWGYRKLRLEVRASNAAARALYSRLGFTYRARMRAYYSDGEDALCLIARLPLKYPDQGGQ